MQRPVFLLSRRAKVAMSRLGEEKRREKILFHIDFVPSLCCPCHRRCTAPSTFVVVANKVANLCECIFASLNASVTFLHLASSEK